MRYLFITTASLIGITFCASSQTIRQYLDKNCLLTGDSTQACYYRVVETSGNAFVVKDYYITGELEMIAECSAVEPQLVKNGKCVWYYKNGALKQEEAYFMNSPAGLSKAYYESNRPKSEILHRNSKKIYIQHWAENGDPLLKDGQGLIVDEDPEREMYHHTEVKDSMVVNSFSLQKGSADTIYTFLERPPEYIGGHEKLIRDIRANVRYPRSARKQGIDGIVYVQFTIDKQGNLIAPQVLRGIQSDCDKIALQAVSKLNRWSPGLAHNKPVLVRFVLPIKFTLK